MLTKRRVIGVAGRIASNKSSVAESLGKSLRTKPISFGDFCRNAAKQAWGREDRQLLQEIGGTLVKYPKEFCERVLESSHVDLGQDLVIEGIRHVEVYESLQKLLGPAEYDLVYVNAPERDIRARLMMEHTPEREISVLESDETEDELRDVLPKLASITVGWSHGLHADDLSSQVFSALDERLARVTALGEYQKADWNRFRQLIEKRRTGRLRSAEVAELAEFERMVALFDEQEIFEGRYSLERSLMDHQRYLNSVNRLVKGLEAWIGNHEVLQG